MKKITLTFALLAVFAVGAVDLIAKDISGEVYGELSGTKSPAPAVVPAAVPAAPAAPGAGDEAGLLDPSRFAQCWWGAALRFESCRDHLGDPRPYQIISTYDRGDRGRYCANVYLDMTSGSSTGRPVSVSVAEVKGWGEDVKGNWPTRELVRKSQVGERMYFNEAGVGHSGLLLLNIDMETSWDLREGNPYKDHRYKYEASFKIEGCDPQGWPSVWHDQDSQPKLVQGNNTATPQIRWEPENKLFSVRYMGTIKRDGFSSNFIGDYQKPVAVSGFIPKPPEKSIPSIDAGLPDRAKKLNKAILHVMNSSLSVSEETAAWDEYKEKYGTGGDIYKFFRGSREDFVFLAGMLVDQGYSDTLKLYRAYRMKQIVETGLNIAGKMRVGKGQVGY